MNFCRVFQARHCVPPMYGIGNQIVRVQQPSTTFNIRKHFFKRLFKNNKQHSLKKVEINLLLCIHCQIDSFVGCDGLCDFLPGVTLCIKVRQCRSCSATASSPRLRSIIRKIRLLDLF